MTPKYAQLRRRAEMLAPLRRAGRAGPLELTMGPALQARPLARSVERGIDFLRPRDLAGEDTGRTGALRSKLDADAKALAEASTAAEAAATVPWYHTIELPGHTTEGYYDHRSLVPHYGLPEDLSGTRALDVATFNGFWAFELERRGAEVTAIDLPSSRDYDLPPALRDLVEREGIDLEPGAAFRVAAEALGSTVERKLANIYDLDPGDLGTFDLVHMGDILVHVERPVEALRAVRSVAHGDLHLSEAFDPRLNGATLRYLGGWSDMEWWVPSFDALVQMVSDAGFRNIRTVGTYQLNSRGGSGAHWRAILSASV